MYDFIMSILIMLYDAFIYPVLDFLTDGYEKPLPIIKVGFGSVEWLSMDLDMLLRSVLGIALSTIMLVFIFKLLKWFTKFGGRKKW